MTGQMDKLKHCKSNLVFLSQFSLYFSPDLTPVKILIPDINNI